MHIGIKKDVLWKLNNVLRNLKISFEKEMSAELRRNIDTAICHWMLEDFLKEWKGHEEKKACGSRQSYQEYHVRDMWPAEKL